MNFHESRESIKTLRRKGVVEMLEQNLKHTNHLKIRVNISSQDKKEILILMILRL